MQYVAQLLDPWITVTCVLFGFLFFVKLLRSLT